jgi:hypothetical protein
VDWAVYGALIVGFLAVAGAAAYLVVQALRGWRAFKRLRRHTAKELARLAAVADETAQHASRAGDQSRLTASVGRMHVALAQFAVIRSAVDEATDAFARFTSVVPRK